MTNKAARPIPDWPRVTIRGKDYMIDPTGAVHTLYSSCNFMQGTPSYGKPRLEYRKLRLQNSDLANAVRARHMAVINTPRA